MSNNKDFKVKNGIQPTVYHEGLGTVVSGSVGYYLAGASYDSVSFSVNSQATGPRSLYFKGDGLKLYISDDSTDSIYQYTLSTAWDVSTASYDSVSFSVSSQDTSPTGIYFKSDGTTLYVAGNSTDDIFQYTLSTAWDLSTASYASKSFAITQDTGLRGVSFKSDGTKMYAVGFSTDSVYQYSLSTAWDVSTASYDSVSFSVTSQDTTPLSMWFKSDGTYFYTSGGDNDTIYQYALSTAWDLSTASYSSISFSVSSQDASPSGVFFGDDGLKMYIVGQTNQAIYQYSTVLTTNTLDLSTGSVFEITPTSDIQVALSNPAASGTSSGATLLLDGSGEAYILENATYVQEKSLSANTNNGEAFHFSSDGTRLYIIEGGFDIQLYDLSVAFDISTATHDQQLNGQTITSSVENRVGGMFFKPDGTACFVAGGSTDKIYQLSLSTAWDLSTATLDTSFSITDPSTLANNPNIWFNASGTKMILADHSARKVYGYDLSTAWDISTADHDNNEYSADAESTSDPEGLWLNPTGTKLWLMKSDDTIYQYSLGTALDVSTSSYDNISFSVSSETTNPTDLFFTSSGKMFVLSLTSEVYEYDVVSSNTITYDSTLQWSGGTAPTSPAIGDTDVITFNTIDGGTTYKSVLAIDGAS